MWTVMMQIRSEKRSAFTLIELLVVIAIIAILAAILFPVFAQAKEAAKKTTCLSNTKQIALGVYLYVGDFDDTLPQTSWESGATPQPFNPSGKYQIHWSYLIQPYVKSWNIFVCPSDPKPTPTDSPCATGVSEIGTLTGGSMTCDWAAQTNSYIPIYNAMPAHDWTVVSLSAYSNPSNQIVVGEHRNDGIASDGHKGTSGFYPSQPCGSVGGQSLPSDPTVAKSGTGSGYAYFNVAFLNAAYASAQKNAVGSSAYGKFFKAYDTIRVAWDRHSSLQGGNYSFADGHAKYETLGKTIDNTAYQYGDQWYPTPQPWGSCP